MKAVTGPLPPDNGAWAFEIKWDGMRVLAHLDGQGGVRLRGAKGAAAGASCRARGGLTHATRARAAVLGGGVAASDAAGRPSFGRLQQRMHVSSPADAARRAVDDPVIYVVFDLLALDG